MDNATYLRSKGFSLLTGEACGYSMRILVDVTEEALNILNQFFGCKMILPQRPWNSGSVGSVMLARNMIWDELIPFMLLNDGAYVVYRILDEGFSHEWYAQSKEFWDDRGDRFNHFQNVQVFINWNGTSRNRHEWTERVE